MEKDRKNDRLDPEQKKWEESGPDNASGRRGGEGGESYNQGKKAPAGSPETSTGDMRSGVFGQREGRHRDTQEGMADSLGGPGAGTNNPSTENERRFGGSHTAGAPVKKEESEWKGGTPDQGPTTGGMGSAGGGHDTDETDVWGDKDRTKE